MKIHFAMSKKDLEEILETKIDDDSWQQFVRRNSQRMNDELRLIVAKKFEEKS